MALRAIKTSPLFYKIQLNAQTLRDILIILLYIHQNNKAVDMLTKYDDSLKCAKHTTINSTIDSEYIITTEMIRKN